MTEWEQGEPFFVPLTERMLDVVIAPGLSPEEEAMMREEVSWATDATEDDDAEPAPVTLPPELVHAIDVALLPEERYALEAALRGTPQRTIAKAMGISQPSLCVRIQRAKERVRLQLAGEPLPPRGQSRARMPGGNDGA